MTEQAAQERLRVAMEALGERARHNAARRVAVLEEAVITLLDGRLDDATCATAHGEAHRIAGSAAMFGFPRATEVARDLESIFEDRHTAEAGSTRATDLIERLKDSFAQGVLPGTTGEPGAPPDPPAGSRP